MLLQAAVSAGPSFHSVHDVGSDDEGSVFLNVVVSMAFLVKTSHWVCSGAVQA